VTDNIFFGWCWKTFPLSDELMMPGDSFRPLSDELMMAGDSFRSRTKALLGLVPFQKKNPTLPWRESLGISSCTPLCPAGTRDSR